MKAVLGDRLPAGPEWVHEIKWDGVRVVATVAGGRVVLHSSRGNEVTSSYPELAALAPALDPCEAVLDGEVVALDATGKPDFGLLQGRMHVHDASESARRAATIPVVYEIFDLLWLDGIDTTGQALTDRRRLLDDLVEPGPAWQLSPVHTDGEALLEAMRTLGMEGVMAKRSDSVYLPGRRSPAWRKVKVRRRQELVVGGWAEGSGNRAGRLGALLVGYHEGDALRYAGRVGTGFSYQELARLGRALADLALDADAPCPFDPPPPGPHRRGAHWVRPDLVVEVGFGEWTGDGRLRHPSYLGQRTDKEPSAVVREWPGPA